MMETTKTPSFHLGELVALVSLAEPEEQNWGEDTFILFQANFVGTIQLLASVIQGLPPETLTADGRTLQQKDLEALGKGVDYASLEQGLLNHDEFMAGYHSILSAPVATETEKQPDRYLSYHFGVFLAFVHCMEKGSGLYHHDTPKGEDQYFLLRLNFSNTLNMIQNSVKNLPAVAFYRGKEITLDQIKRIYETINTNILSPEILEKLAFVQGYEKVIADFEGR